MKSADLLYEELCTQILGEAPITDVGVSSTEYPEIPKKNTPSLLASKQTRADLRLIGNPRYLERLSAETARNIPFNIKLILVDQDPGELFKHISHLNRDLMSGVTDMSNLAKLAWPPTKDVITLVTGPSGDPMKLSANKKGAWMIGHKLGHALFDNINIRNNKEMRANVEIYNSIERETLWYFERYCSTLSAHEIRYPKDTKFRMFYKTISRFQSAQTSNILSFEEYLFELVGQYVMFGKVTFRYNPAYASQAFDSQEEADKIADTITKMIIAGMHNAVGKTIVDVG